MNFFRKMIFAFLILIPSILATETGACFTRFGLSIESCSYHEGGHSIISILKKQCLRSGQRWQRSCPGKFACVLEHPTLELVTKTYIYGVTEEAAFDSCRFLDGQFVTQDESSAL